MKAFVTTLLAVSFWATPALANPPKKLPDYSWLTIRKDRLTIQAARYKPGSVKNALKNLSGLFTIFKPQPQNDPTLRVVSTKYDHATQTLDLHVKKKVLVRWINETTSIKINVLPYSSCSAGTGYEIKMDTGDDKRAREVRLRLCANELPDGSLVLDTELALVVGHSYEQWVYWSTEDLYRTLPSSLLQHIKNIAAAQPGAMNYNQMFHKIAVKNPPELFPQMEVVPAAHDEDDEEDTFLN